MSKEARGVVVTFDEQRGFGFIRSPSFADDVFVHVSAIVDGNRNGLRPGQRVRFLAEGSDRGPRAVQVHPGKVGLPPALASSLLLIGFVGLTSVGLTVTGIPRVASWLFPMNLTTLVVWTWDKHRAVRDGRRVSEAALLSLAALGGMIGAWIGVGALGHKRRKPRFLIALGAITTLQIIAALALLLRG